MVELLGGHLLIGGIDNHIFVACGLHDGLRLHHAVALHLHLGKVLAEGPLVAATLLVGGHHYSALLGEPCHILLALHEGHLREFAQQLGVVAVFERFGHLHDAPVAHAIHQQVGAALHEHRGFQPVAPVVIVGEPAQRGLDAANDYGGVWVELFEDFGVGHNGIVGAALLKLVDDFLFALDSQDTIHHHQIYNEYLIYLHVPFHAKHHHAPNQQHQLHQQHWRPIQIFESSLYI